MSRLRFINWPDFIKRFIMSSQKDLFQLPEDIHYLNCGYISPLLKSVEEAGIRGMQRKRNPSGIFADDFFNESETLRLLFSRLINCNPGQVAVIPSTSYAFQTAVNNLPVNKGSHAITVSDEFPSDYYTIRRWCAENGKELKVIEGGKNQKGRAQSWNARILETISNETAAVIMSSIHWMDGTTFDLKAIGKRCKEVNALFIVDGTQSVGALPIDVKEYNIDVLACAAYKWLLGPYSIGLAYYSEFFNNGIPLEESWLNRANARNFPGLTTYTNDYHAAGASRYNVGEYSNFILTPMLIKSLEQIINWKVDFIQDYCKQVSRPLIDFLRENDFKTEEEHFRAGHLFGFQLPAGLDAVRLLGELQKRKIFVSVRGDSIRVSPHLYNTDNDIAMLIEALKEVV
jgi:selenocysteine lyase/cysteine desulfurase